VFAEFRPEKDSASDQVVVDVRNPAAGSKVKEVKVDESPPSRGFGRGRNDAGGNQAGRGFFNDTFGEGGDAVAVNSYAGPNRMGRDSSDDSLGSRGSSASGLDLGEDPAFAGMEFGSR